MSVCFLRFKTSPQFPYLFQSAAKLFCCEVPEMMMKLYSPSHRHVGEKIMTEFSFWDKLLFSQ